MIPGMQHIPAQALQQCVVLQDLEFSFDDSATIMQLDLGHLTALTCLGRHGTAPKLPKDCILPTSIVKLCGCDLIDAACLMPLQHLQVGRQAGWGVDSVVTCVRHQGFRICSTHGQKSICKDLTPCTELPASGLLRPNGCKPFCDN